MVSVSTVAEAAMAPAMISPCVSRLCTRASIRPCAELVEVEEADEEGDEPGEVEDDDAARQARGGALARAGASIAPDAR